MSWFLGGGADGLAGMPWFPPIVAASVTLELVVLIRAVRSYARSRRTEEGSGALGSGARERSLLAFSAIGPVLALIATALAIQEARRPLLQGATSADIARSSVMIFEGVSGEPAVIIVGLTGAMLAAAMAIGAAALAMTGRRRSGAVAVGPGDAAFGQTSTDRTETASIAWAAAFAFFLLGIGPLLVAAICGAHLQLRALEATATAGPELKLGLLADGMRLRSMLLARGFLISCLGTLCTGVLAAAALGIRWRRGRTASRSAAWPPDGKTGEIPMRASLAALVAAAALFGIAKPMRLENEMPWPAGTPGNRLGAAAPALEGPDQLERGPSVEVSSTGLSVERAAGDLSDLERRLRSYRRDHALLHPGEPGPRQVVLICAPDVPTPRLASVIDGVRRAEFDAAILALETHTQVSRPWLGDITLHRVTGARVSLDGTATLSPGNDATTVRVEDSSDCALLAKRVVELRRMGRHVALVRSPSDSGETHQPGHE